MKYCPSCGKELLEGANFCGQCGTKIEKEIPKEVPLTKEEPPKTPVEPVVAKKISPVKAERSEIIKKKRPNPLIITLLLIIFGIGLAIWFLLSVFTTKPEATITEATDISTTETTSLSTTASTIASTTASSEEPLSAKYDDILENAQRLADEGNYSESELELSTIPEEVLARSEYASVKKVVDEIHAQNQPAIEAAKAKEEAEQKKAEQEQKAKEEQAKKEKANKKEEKSDPVFVGDFASWATSYGFYFAQEKQNQSSLTIGTDGRVTKDAQTGKATVENYSGDTLSYETNEQKPTKIPATKTVHPNVRITIKWDNGGSQVLYGYTSFTGRLVLTDGASKGNGINEVWITN
ncbi:hypothetical protein DOK78_001709 [Enterococcus sp. DIV2402]|uniref:Zinc-ribbon domain-containing protein n=1 Tax=Candidatus Enterococcus lowellii TaxID=2230877 RepID=A0ABZ2SMN0_9ENTE|nr:zinc ribbon domain-containing protein [Enterococcus sp. DIV2402]MBO0464105.1 zinc ribbon domain-containing protein [Enterococcus sp. DIV2402]